MESRILLLFCYCSIIVPLIQAQAPPVLHLPFDGQITKQENSSIRYNEVASTFDPYGHAYQAARFSGKKSYLYVPFDIRATRMPQLSIVAWVKVPRVYKPMVVLSNDRDGLGRTIYIGRNKNKQYQWMLKAGESCIYGPLVTENEWIFLAATYNQVDSVFSFCVNDTCLQAKGRTASAHTFFKLGSSTVSVGSYFGGVIDELRLYDRMLSVQEINELFAKESKNQIEPDEEKQFYHSTEDRIADIVVRVGDMDNFGFGWQANFSVFSGESAPRHPFPWEADADDHQGTDRIMWGRPPNKKSLHKDGYSKMYLQYDTRPVPISIQFPKPKIEIQEAILQMYIDDFQAPVYGSRFQLSLNGKRIPHMEGVLNSVEQSGPVGKVISLGILKEDLPLLKTGKLQLLIDDPTSGIGDGFAIDFVRLLINPHFEEKYVATISGKVVDEQGIPIPKALVSNAGMNEVLTNEKGIFVMKKVPAGLAYIHAQRIGYMGDSKMIDIEEGAHKRVNLVLVKRAPETAALINEQLETKGELDVYGIHFDANSRTPNAKSDSTLSALLKSLQADTNLRLHIIGHTDSDGSESYNQQLSIERAKAIVQWLTSRGVTSDRLQANGSGESMPRVSNLTEEGKALNRRVTIRSGSKE